MKLILDAHRRTGHRGVTHTMSEVNRHWFLAGGGLRVCNSIISACITCKMKNSTVRWSFLPEVKAREDQPVYTRIAIDHLHLPNKLCLAIVCIDTVT